MASKSKSNKGSVGFAYGGVMKLNTSFVFKSTKKEPSDIQSDLVQYYGPGITLKYVNVEEAKLDEIFKEFQTKLAEYNLATTRLYDISIATGSNTLREISGLKCHRLDFSKKSNEDEVEVVETDEVETKQSTAKTDKKPKVEVKETKEVKTKEVKPKEVKSKTKAKSESESESESNSDSESETIVVAKSTKKVKTTKVKEEDDDSEGEKLKREPVKTKTKSKSKN
jgi:hypothetical protein